MNIIKSKRKAMVLILSFFIIVILIISGGAAIWKGIYERNTTIRNRLETEALYLAEAAVEQVSYNLAYKVANYVAEPTGSSDFFNLSDLTGTLANYLSSGYTVQYSCRSLDLEQASADALGISTFSRHYLVTATITHPDYDISVTVNQTIARHKTYTFQHAVFYVDDLEMLPGASMTLSGRVHSNSSVYVGTHNTFTLNTNYFHSAEDIYYHRKDDGTTLGGSVRILVNGTTDYELMKKPAEVALDSNRDDWYSESQLRWLGTVASSEHGVTARAAPVIESIQPDSFFSTTAQNAGMQITRNSDGTYTIYHKGSTISSTDLPGGTITESSFQDNREGKIVSVTNIDIQKLNQREEFTDLNSNESYDAGESYIDANGNGEYDPSYFPSGEIIYATRVDSSSAQPNGIRIVNGSELNGPVTIVSNNPVYVQGDYNNINKKGSAVIADAINILSNNWNDGISSFSSRNATSTSVNAAFITGIVPTPDGGGTYSGGLENYPRLHENWTNDTLQIRGSFVELWESDIAQGSWLYGSPRYTAPVRNWDYDTGFNDPNNLPPYTPCAVEIERVAWSSS